MSAAAPATAPARKAHERDHPKVTQMNRCRRSSAEQFIQTTVTCAAEPVGGTAMTDGDAARRHLTGPGLLPSYVCGNKNLPLLNSRRKIQTDFVFVCLKYSELFKSPLLIKTEGRKGE